MKLLKDRINIAIDGPAGAGKSTVAKIIAEKLGIIYLDTGAMYRSFALFAMNQGVDTQDQQSLIRILDDFNLEIKYIDNNQHVIMNDEDVTEDIRTNLVSQGASNVAVVPEVRIKLVDIQREIAENNSIIMDGRDIGTFVLPNADLKIFLTASVDVRAMRRYEDLKEKGIIDSTITEIKQEIILRDANDSQREFAPLVKADDAIEVDSSEFEIQQTVSKILEILRSNGCIQY